ncbi:MAG: DUF1476 domain-containing protein [Alphaproteobacteria bacterium]|nr:DUF1476 domain-containing protein [Alphaproteobacteria bacterium]
MSGFDEREKTHEKQFAVDEATKFKIEVRRNKLLGLWAAEHLGLKGADAEAYAKSVVEADFEHAGDDDVFRKLRKDFDDRKLDMSDHRIRRTMDELKAEAAQQIKAGK